MLQINFSGINYICPDIYKNKDYLIFSQNLYLDQEWQIHSMFTSVSLFCYYWHLYSNPALFNVILEFRLQSYQTFDSYCQFTWIGKRAKFAISDFDVLIETVMCYLLMGCKVNLLVWKISDCTEYSKAKFFHNLYMHANLRIIAKLIYVFKCTHYMCECCVNLVTR